MLNGAVLSSTVRCGLISGCYNVRGYEQELASIYGRLPFKPYKDFTKEVPSDFSA